MPFPQTLDEAKAQGYKFAEPSTCQGVQCQMDIEWWHTPTGKWIPIDARQDGKFVPHWASCPNRGEFRASRKAS